MLKTTKITITGKKQLTDRIAKNLSKQRLNLTKTQIESVITELLEATSQALIKGEEVRFLGYYSLKTTLQKARLAMNLQTGKKMKVPAKRVPKCKFSLSLKEEISEK